MKDTGITLSYEAADCIALAVLQDHYKMILEEIDKHTNKGRWMHPEDVVHNAKLIDALKLLILYYGGTLDDK